VLLHKANTDDEPLAVTYKRNIENIAVFISNVRKFMLSLNSDKARENFVKIELSRNLMVH